MNLKIFVLLIIPHLNGPPLANAAPPSIPPESGPGTLQLVLDAYSDQFRSGLQAQELQGFATSDDPEQFYVGWLEAFDAAIDADPTSSMMPTALIIKASLLNATGGFEEAASLIRDHAGAASTPELRAFWYAQALDSQAYTLGLNRETIGRESIDQGIVDLGSILTNLDPQSASSQTIGMAVAACQNLLAAIDLVRASGLGCNLSNLGGHAHQIYQMLADSPSGATQAAITDFEITPTSILAAEFEIQVVVGDIASADQIMSILASQGGVNADLPYKVRRLELSLAINDERDDYLNGMSSLIQQSVWNNNSATLAVRIMNEAHVTWSGFDDFLLYFYARCGEMTWLDAEGQETMRARVAASLWAHYRAVEDGENALFWRDRAMDHGLQEIDLISPSE